MNTQAFKQILKPTAIALAVFLFSVANINAQLDPTFGTNGVVTTNVSAIDTPLESFVLPDGKILVVNRGGVFPVNYYFVKYNGNGTLDTTYGTGGIFQLTIPAGSSG